MTPSLPIPTDNIHKFTCIFGLSLVGLSIFLYVFAYTSFLDRKVKHTEAIIQLENKTDRNKIENDLLELNKTLLDVAKTNQSTATIGTFVFFFLGLGFCVYGARNWREKIQKRDDRLAQLQIEKLETEINKLRAEVENANRRA